MKRPQKGDFVRIVGTHNSHSFKTGDIVRLLRSWTRPESDSGYVQCGNNTNPRGECGCIQLRDMEIL